MSSNNSTSHLILFSLLLLLILDSTELTVARSCRKHCGGGGIDIPYPFGIGEGCYLEKWYEIICVNSSVPGKLLPILAVISKEVVKISVPSQLKYDDKPLSYGSVLIKNPITSKGCSIIKEEENGSLLNLTGTPFYVAYINTLIGVGNDNKVSLTNVEPSIVGCMSSSGEVKQTSSEDDYITTIDCNTKALLLDQSILSCNATSMSNETSCNGIGCCKASMPDGTQQVVGVKIEDSYTTTGDCKVAFITSQSNYSLSRSTPQQLHATGYSIVELGWFIHTTNLSFLDSLGCQNIADCSEGKNFYTRKSCVCEPNAKSGYANCACTFGYRGNPYALAKCKDINECLETYPAGSPICKKGKKCVNWDGYYECLFPKHLLTAIGISVGFGSLIFVSGIYGLCKFVRKQIKLSKKKIFFKRNGGLLLQQQLNSTTGNIEKTRVFSSRELQKATENFSFSRVLGQGGQGTVYKGMLVDGRIVAVKKSKIVDEDKLEEFINEVVILSQINHRNIVKLLGCCLETDVPVLVYEYIPNGNLFEYLHGEFDDYTMTTWDMRLRIAVDISGALSYLHFAASSPIYHRDVKSTNIMLDEKYRAKISDFGTSRSVTVDHTHLTTIISGTIGYMDPEYLQSSQYTDKSDVYSFGVVLAELITGEKSYSFIRSQDNRTLATYFVLAMKENKLFDIIDARIKDKCELDQVAAVANVASRCLNLKGKKRPNMREVSMELERIRTSLGYFQPTVYVGENEEEKDEGVVEPNIREESSKNVVVTVPTPQYDNVAESSSSRPYVESSSPL